MEGKTIRVLASELGVTKQTISYRLKQLEKTHDQKKDGVLATKIDGVVIVSLVGESLVKSAFSMDDNQNIGAKKSPTTNQNNDGVLVVLKATIDTLTEQLKVKDEQISRLTTELEEAREHSRSQADTIAKQADNFAALANQAHQLHAKTLVDHTHTAGGFFKRLLGIKPAE